ncbi:hypothetical protein ACWEPC_44560, partial [Nonomuraea sp. NPDC004297]
MGGSGEKRMGRRRLLACGLGVAAGMAAGVAGCGTERAGGVLRTGFLIHASGHRWDRAGKAFADAARTMGFTPDGRQVA